MPVSVLVVDGTATRQALLDVLGADPELRPALADPTRDLVGQIRRQRPQLILLAGRHQLDDDFALAKDIMATAPAPIVIAADFDARDPALSDQALRAGVLAVVARPGAPGTAAFEQASAELRRIVKAMAQVKVVRRWPDRAARAPAVAVPPSSPMVASRFRLLAIAASTGGPAAVQQVLTELPGTLPVPVLIVQHIAAGFIQGLAERLDGLCALKVKVAERGEELLPGTAYLAPDGYHLGIAWPLKAALLMAPPISGVRPSATHLFRSVASVLGPAACAVILTGMGEDGVEGLRLVHQNGGRVIAQDEATSVVFGMPAAAIAAGVTDEVLPLTSIAPRLKLMLGSF